MLTLGLRLNLPVSGGLVEDDHHARSREDGVFRHLVTGTVTIPQYRFNKTKQHTQTPSP